MTLPINRTFVIRNGVDRRRFFLFYGGFRMVVRLKLVLEQDEYSALMESALADLRNPSDQARFILRQELERLGLLNVKRVPIIQADILPKLNPLADQ